MDKKALEKAYNLGLKLEKAGDFDGAAKAYEEALRLDPDDHGGVAVRLASIGKGEVPEMAPKAYVATLFDQMAEMFDDILVDQLHYDVPLQLREMLIENTNGRIFSKMLDLGCGTGLSADALDDVALKKTGVDISENMIEIAYEKGDYSQLFVADAVDFVEKSKDKWSLIVATDVLPYMGDIERFFAGISSCLEEEGVFGFSTETLNDDAFFGRNFKVGPHQRFAHKKTYIENMLTSHFMTVMDCRDITVREELGLAVDGHLFLAKKA